MDLLWWPDVFVGVWLGLAAAMGWLLAFGRFWFARLAARRLEQQGALIPGKDESTGDFVHRASARLLEILRQRSRDPQAVALVLYGPHPDHSDEGSSWALAGANAESVAEAMETIAGHPAGTRIERLPANGS